MVALRRRMARDGAPARESPGMDGSAGSGGNGVFDQLSAVVAKAQSLSESVTQEMQGMEDKAQTVADKANEMIGQAKVMVHQGVSDPETASHLVAKLSELSSEAFHTGQQYETEIKQAADNFIQGDLMSEGRLLLASAQAEAGNDIGKKMKVQKAESALDGIEASVKEVSEEVAEILQRMAPTANIEGISSALRETANSARNDNLSRETASEPAIMKVTPSVMSGPS